MTEKVIDIEKIDLEYGDHEPAERSSTPSAFISDKEMEDETASSEEFQIPSSEKEDPLSRYIRTVNKYPLLSLEDETGLARKWIQEKDKNAADKLLTSHMRLVVKVAYTYKNYKLPMEDIIGQGSIGLFHALRNFDPDLGNRFSTYAMWWIHAEIKDYVLHNWSLIKIGTTRAQKRLFFSLRKVKQKIHTEMESEGSLSFQDMQKIAKEVDVSVEAVQSMEIRLKGKDFSLNTVIGDEDGNDEWQDFIAHDSPDPEELVLEKDEFSKRKDLLEKALQKLNPRESEILTKRRLQEKPETLEALSSTYGLSKERIRQIESKAFKKIQMDVNKI